jgi:hypothetical protein
MYIAKGSAPRRAMRSALRAIDSGIATRRESAAEYFGKSCDNSFKAYRGLAEAMISADALSPRSDVSDDRTLLTHPSLRILREGRIVQPMDRSPRSPQRFQTSKWHS